MRVLVYGFGPYKAFRDNITAKIIEALPDRPGLTKVVFPVRFHRTPFVQALEKHRPDAVIGLGQCGRRRIEIETRAKNGRRTRKTDALKPIRRNGPKILPTTLQIKLSRRMAVSNNAGDYVCNYSVYVMLDYFSRRAPQAKLGFIHIPHDYTVSTVTKMVAGAVDKLLVKRGFSA
jgi:pyrrolidone-carboxylate peptidase